MNYEKFDVAIHGMQKNIFLVNMTKELDPHFSQLTIKWLQKYIRQGKKIALIVNKKWYAAGVICRLCGHIPQCNKCSVSISFHKADDGTMTGLCHICKTHYTLPTVCPVCHQWALKSYGIGTQKVAEYIYDTFGVRSFVIESETVNSPKKIQKVQESIHDAQVIIGTSLLTTPPSGIDIDLVVILNADIGLHIPDYTAQERNFWFLYETFAKYHTKQFIVQTFNPQHDSIRYACKLDHAWFHTYNDAFKREHLYPPFGELCVLMYKNEVEEKVFGQIDKLYKELLYFKEKYQFTDLTIYNTPPLVYKMFGKYRYNIIIKGTQVKNFMDIVYTKCKISSKGFKIDWNAQSVV